MAFEPEKITIAARDLLLCRTASPDCLFKAADSGVFQLLDKLLPKYDLYILLRIQADEDAKQAMELLRSCLGSTFDSRVGDLC